ncbi:peptidoglycan bridge formation glycyltransferase FemA/FemB family protein [Candidatus Gracilibacteria bacterium]|nr:peptidoglycan bridge formation glycyltransferase FemA/FemB family protein [Candidatus Gracilibacteria bacterium]
MTIWQTKNWQEMLLKSNQVSKYFEIDGIFIEKRSIGLNKYGLFILGVLDINKIDENKLIEICQKENALFIQVETFDIEKKSLNNLKINSKFKPGYYKKFITPHTAIIDLNLSLDEILEKMKPKGRYNIKLATKKGVSVFESLKNDENIKNFYNLMQETTSRDNFFGNTFNYYKNFLNSLDNSKLFFAKYEDKIISAGIFTFDKDISIYYYGASTSDKNYRNLMAPYALQWEVIQKSKEFGSKYYDFLGIAGPLEKNSPLSGVTDFKLKFTCNTLEISKSYIYINKKFEFFIFNLLKKIKSRFF